MPDHDYLPSRDALLQSFTDNMGRIVSTDPVPFGITPQQATDYVALQAEFATKLVAATEPSTRGKRTVFEKDDSKKRLVKRTREFAMTIGKSMNVSNGQRQELGLPILPATRSTVNPPTQKPIAVVTSVDGRTVGMELRHNAERPGKAPNAVASTVFTYIGETPPSGADGWTFALNTTKTKFNIHFPASAVGQTAWITVFWRNAKDQSSPASTPVMVSLPAGGVLPQGVSRMKIAA